MLKIKPLYDNIQIELEEAKAGALVTTSRESAVEYAKVVGMSKSQEGLSIKVGDHVFVKSWAVDIISYNDKKYYFVNITTGGILAVVS